jgi:hypothetical protein
VTEDPPGFSIHESATVSHGVPMSPCYNNLVYLRRREGAESRRHGVPELREKWSWQGQHTQPRLLPPEEREVARRAAVHLGDVKYTLRRRARSGRRARQAPAEPRKEWYANIEAIEDGRSATRSSSG